MENILLPLLGVAVGFVLLMGGANYLVKGSVAIANKLNIPPLVVGLTVVAFGTSVPEFVVSIKSALIGAGGISVGNVVGSNIANVLLILGVSAIISPLAIDKKSFIKDFCFLMVVTIVFVAFALTGAFVTWMGLLMLCMLLGFVIFSYYSSKNNKNIDNPSAKSPMADKPWLMVICVTVASIAVIIFGSDLLVNGAVTIAQSFGVSEEIIGLTLVAFGTSVPELATSAVAAYRKQSEIAIGNVMGSNIWNILFIIGASSSIIDIEVSKQIMHYDMWIMLATSAMLFFATKKGNIGRKAGIIFFIIYILYIMSQIYISA